MKTVTSEGKRAKIGFAWNNSLIVIAATVFFLAAVSITTMQLETGNGPPSAGAAFSIPRQIQYSFTLQNRSHQMLKKAELWTFAPVKQTANQQCLTLESNYPYKLLTDDSGNQFLYFTFENLAPYGSRVVTIKANLLVSASPNPLASKPCPLDLDPQKHIESDHPAIIQVAHQLQTSGLSCTTEKVFNWVAHHVRYSGYADEDRGALYALEHRKGDCTEFADLFVALCRASGIPARPIGGYICRQNGVIRARDYHNWGEFYEDGTWNIADPQNNVLMQNGADYIAMRIIHAAEDNLMGPYTRFRFKGQGLKVRMN